MRQRRLSAQPPHASRLKVLGLVGRSDAALKIFVRGASRDDHADAAKRPQTCAGRFSGD